jgi:hypothetical protein
MKRNEIEKKRIFNMLHRIVLWTWYGCGYLDGYGYHPGHGYVVLLIVLGVVAGADSGWKGMLCGSGIMTLTFGIPYLIGAYGRGKDFYSQNKFMPKPVKVTPTHKCGQHIPKTSAVRLFVDDLRDPALLGMKGWIVARTSSEAIAILSQGNVTECSLDHDLGGDDTGYRVVCWMEKNNIWPPNGTCCHSANPVGKAKIESVISQAYINLIGTKKQKL